MMRITPIPILSQEIRQPIKKQKHLDDLKTGKKFDTQTFSVWIYKNLEKRHNSRTHEPGFTKNMLCIYKSTLHREQVSFS